MAVQQLRLPAARRHRGARVGTELLRLRPRSHLRACRHDGQRVRAGGCRGARPREGLHAAEGRVDTEHRHAALPGHVGWRGLHDGGRSASLCVGLDRPRAAGREAHGADDQGKSRYRPGRQVRLRVRREHGWRREELRPQRRRAGHERGPADLPGFGYAVAALANTGSGASQVVSWVGERLPAPRRP